jgi:outer membrane protein TolC
MRQLRAKAGRRRPAGKHAIERAGHMTAAATRGMIGLLLPFAVAACMVGPDFSTPDAPVAEQWLESGDPAVRTDHQDYTAWWSAFGDPTLSNLVDHAYGQNLGLMAAGARVLEARAALGVAIGQFYPQQQQVGGAVTYNPFS